MRYLLFILLTLACSCNGARMVQTNLYFGQYKLDGGSVKDEEWNLFLKNYVTKVFPDGSTVLDAAGNWYDTSSNTLISEPSKIVMAVYKSSPQQDRMIDSLRTWYKTLYQQQSVLRVDRKVKAQLF